MRKQIIKTVTRGGGGCKGNKIKADTGVLEHITVKEMEIISKKVHPFDFYSVEKNRKTNE